jgi:DNA polymerase-3 subunit epsilon
LVSFAAGLGIGRDQVSELHRRYLAALATAALADAVVTADERDDLTDVAGLLSLTPADVDRALAEAQTSDPGYALPGFQLQPGDHVVFTGELDEPREVWEARATAPRWVSCHAAGSARRPDWWLRLTRTPCQARRIRPGTWACR